VCLLIDPETKLVESIVINLALTMLTSIGMVLALLSVILHLIEPPSLTLVLAVINVPRERSFYTGMAPVFLLVFIHWFLRPRMANLSACSLVNRANSCTGIEPVSQNVLPLLSKEPKVE